MSPQKTISLFDLDNGRPAIQQLCCRNYVHCRGSSNDSQSSASFSDQASDIEPINFWDCKSFPLKSNGMYQEEHQTEPFYSTSPLSLAVNNEDMMNLGVYNKGAHLVLKTPPEHRFRYRYDTEMSGTHGSLQGIKAGSKSVVEVELVNYPDEALIRVSLVTCNEVGERYPHPHSLFVKQKMYQKKMYEYLYNKTLTKTGHYCDPHYIRVGVNGVDYVARFEGMCIISAKKENFSASIKEKLRTRNVEQDLKIVEKDILKKVDEAVKLVDLDFVSLCFEAFCEKDGHFVRICPPLYSDRIGNAKSANTGMLKISRINKCSGSCKGGDEIWLLVEKINKKGLVIRFFEEIDGKLLWESCIEGDDIILHHQYAIIFKTPPYKDPNISSEVKVLMRLERSSQLSQAYDYSEPITFVYEPPKNKNYKNDNLYRKESILPPIKQAYTKRPRTDSSVVSAINFQYKRKKDEQDCSSPTVEDFDLDYLATDNLFDSHVFTSDEWRHYFDDLDTNFQKDGVSSAIKSREDLLSLIFLRCPKRDESEIKKLTAKMSNLKFSKGMGKLKNGSGDEKDVEDAVSTLLSLRERAIEINNTKKEIEKNDCDSLRESVLQNKPEIVKRILKCANCSTQDAELNTPLHLSLLLSHDSCTEYLLKFRREMNTDINLKNIEGKTPLHIAVASGNLLHVQLLIECGADVNHTETKTKRTALHIAVVEKHRDIVRYLVENTNISLDAKDADGKTAYNIAQLLMPPEKAHFERLLKSKPDEKCRAPANKS